MIASDLGFFTGRRIMMLQGPMGPFFNRLKHDLLSVATSVIKIDFNGGDCLFSDKSAIQFRGTKSEWPQFLEQIIHSHQIDTLLFFGDCRRYHVQAKQIAEKCGITVGVFEEGYVRPDYITFELVGVNANSTISRCPEDYLALQRLEIPKVIYCENPLWHAIVWSTLYYSAAILLGFLYPNYEHHRPLTIAESWPWIRSYFRKVWYGFLERNIQAELINKLSGKFFLVPLQVHNDSQLAVHSNFSCVQNFIYVVVQSFARSAPQDSYLILKQHPLDRGYNNHRSWITELTKVLKVDQRVKYIHDQHLPTLLQHSAGVVVVNSTVGLSALHHNKPTKVLGKAIFDLAGLTYQGQLDDFWCASSSFIVNRELYEKFINFVILRTQINGNFYRRLRDMNNKSGVVWT